MLAALCCGLKALLVIDWWLQFVPEIVRHPVSRQAVPLAIVPCPDPDLPTRFRVGNDHTAYQFIDPLSLLSRPGEVHY